MKFEELLDIVRDEPVFASGLLLAGDVDPVDIRRQLSRWVTSGKLVQLRRGLYALASPYRKAIPHPFFVANRLVPGSYVSLQTALAAAGLIPEYTPVVTSVTAGRPGDWHTPLGRFSYRHIQPSFLFGYHQTVLDGNQQAFVALPEKALLDLVYLEADADRPEYLRELRLQHLDTLDADRLRAFSGRMGRPKLRRAVEQVLLLMQEETVYEVL
jgi:predicted transcriptional regulator of viral defense system